MARYQCPSCGRPFNGKKCSHCLFVVFDEEIGHRLHTHKGEPLVIKTGAKRPAPRKNPFEFDRKTRKRKFPLWVALLILFLNPILGIAETIMDPIPDVSAPMPEYAQRETVPQASVPLDAMLVYESSDYTVWLGMGRWGFDFQTPVFVENRTERDVIAGALQIVVNGFLTENSSLYCETPGGCVTEGLLTLSEKDMELAGITQVAELSFILNLYDAETYEDLVMMNFSVTIDGIGMTVSAPSWGYPIAEEEECLITFLGYEVDPNFPENFCEGTLMFYLQNNSGEPLTVYMEECRLNGEEVDIALFTELPAGTRTVTWVYLYDAGDAGVQYFREAESLEIRLALSGDGVPEGHRSLEPVTLDLR